MNKSNKFLLKVHERAVRMMQEQHGKYPSLRAAVESIAPTIGCVSQTFQEWIKGVEVGGVRKGVTTSAAQRSAAQRSAAN